MSREDLQSIQAKRRQGCGCRRPHGKGATRQSVLRAAQNAETWRLRGRRPTANVAGRHVLVEAEADLAVATHACQSFGVQELPTRTMRKNMFPSRGLGCETHRHPDPLAATHFLNCAQWGPVRGTRASVGRCARDAGGVCGREERCALPASFESVGRLKCPRGERGRGGEGGAKGGGQGQGGKERAGARRQVPTPRVHPRACHYIDREAARARASGSNRAPSSTPGRKGDAPTSPPRSRNAHNARANSERRAHNARANSEPPTRRGAFEGECASERNLTAASARPNLWSPSHNTACVTGHRWAYVRQPKAATRNFRRRPRVAVHAAPQ